MKLVKNIEKKIEEKIRKNQSWTFPDVSKIFLIFLLVVFFYIYLFSWRQAIFSWKTF